MYDNKQLIAEYLDAVAAGEGIQQAVGQLMKGLFEKGNVSLLSRPQVSGMMMTHAGWDNISENDTATVYTMWYSGGTDGVPWVEDVVLHMTPIMSNGTVKTPEQLDGYVDELLANNNSVDSLLEADKPSNGGFGLVICVQRAQEGWTKAHDEADIYDTALHQLQAAYYLNGTEDLPLGKDLMTIAGWYSTYKIYIKNYIGFDGEYTTNEDLVYTVPIAINDEANVFTEPKVTGEMGKAGTFEFSMQAGHPYYERLCQMKTIFRVVYDGDTIFRGRVLTIDTNHMNGNKQVHCEGDLAFLLDSQIEGVPDENRTKSDALPYMSSLIAEHNAQMNEDMPDKKFELGEVPGAYSALTKDDQKVHPDGDYRYGSGSWRDSQSAWNDLTGSFGGFIRTRYQNGTCYIDWLDQYFRSGVNPQTIEIRENLIDLSSNSEVDNIFTAVIPVGSNNGKNLYINGYNGWAYNRILVPDIVGFYSDAELNQGFHTKSDYQNAVNNYGIIYHTESFSNADTQAKLWEYALDWIKNNYIGSLYSFEVTALDMHLIGESSGKFLVGDKVNIIYPDTNRQDEDPEATIQKTLTIMGATYSLHDPSRNTYKIGVPNAVLKRNYGEKQKKKTSRASSSLSSQLADEANKQAEEVWEDTEKTYTHANVFGAILANPNRDAEIAQYGQELIDKVERIAEQWLYDTVNGLDSQYGSLPSFLSSGFTTNADVLALGENGRKLLRSRLVLAGNNGLPVWSKTKVTEFGQITEVMTAEYAYPAVVHSKNGGSVAIRKSSSSSSSKVGDVPSNSTVWCRVKPESCKDTWIPVQFGDKIGYMQTKFVVQCTDKYDQGTGYPELTETEKENKISFSQIFNSEDGKTLLSSLGVAMPEELTKIVEEGKLPGVSIDGDGNLQLGDGLNYLINLIGGNSEINLGNGIDILARLFGMNGNDESSGFEFFKKLPGQLQQKILTVFMDGKTGTQTLLKQFFGGNDFTGINDLLTGIGLPTVTISAEGTIELGTGTDAQPVTIKLDGNKNTGDGNKYGWVGIKKSSDGTTSWVIQLNDVITYRDENNKEVTAYGFVSASDFHVPTIPSFKTKLGIFDELVAGKIDTASLSALKAKIDELYATKMEIDGMLTANTLFSGSAYTGHLQISKKEGSTVALTVNGDSVFNGKTSFTTLDLSTLEIKNSIKFTYQDADPTIYNERYVYIGTQQIPNEKILANGALNLPDIIDASSIKKDTDLPDGTIGFKYKTYANSTYKKVNFNIADTNYYKTRVGIKNATIESGDLEDYAGWDESVTFNGTDLKLESPYGLIEVFGNNTGETKNKYSIRIDASDIAGNNLTMETNEVTIGDYVPPTANPRTDIQRYGKYDVRAIATASDGSTKESETTELIPQAAWQAGFNSGQVSISEGEARNNGYIAGYKDAQKSGINVQSYVEQLINGNSAFYDEAKEQLLLEVTATTKMQFKRLLKDGNGDDTASIDSKWDLMNQSAGTPMTDQIPFSMKVVDTELYREDFANGKFVVKSKGDTGEVNIEGTEIDVPLKAALDIPIEGIINPVNNDTTTFTWNTNGDNKYKYTFTTTGSVTSNGTEIIPLSNANNVLDPALAIEHGQNKMGVKAASWKNNVVTFEVEESATKKQSLAIVSQPSYTYDKNTHKYKLSSSAYYVGNNNTNVAITGSSPEAGTYTTDDAAWQAGVAYAQANTPALTVSVSVDPVDQAEYTETEASLANSPETLNASGFYVIKAKVNETERIYKKFKTGAQGTSSNEKIENNRSFGTISANGTGIEIKPSGSNTAMRKATLNVAVPQRSATAIKGTGIGGIIPLTEDDHGTPTKNVTVEYNGADASGNTTSQGSVTINAQPVYYSGQKSVKVLAVVREENLDVDVFDRTAYNDINVYLSNGVVQTIKHVDFTDAYRLGNSEGYRMSDTNEEYNKDYMLTDEDGNMVLVDDHYVTDYKLGFSVELCDKNGTYIGEEHVEVDATDAFDAGWAGDWHVTDDPEVGGYFYVKSIKVISDGTGDLGQSIHDLVNAKEKIAEFYKDGTRTTKHGDLKAGSEVKLLEKSGYWNKAVPYDYWKVSYGELVGYVKKDMLENWHAVPTGDKEGGGLNTSGAVDSVPLTINNVQKVKIDSVVHSDAAFSKNMDLTISPIKGGEGFYTSEAVPSSQFNAIEISTYSTSSFLLQMKNTSENVYFGRHLLRDTSKDITHKLLITVTYSSSAMTKKTGWIEMTSYAIKQLVSYNYSATVINSNGISCPIYDTEGTYGTILGTIPNNSTASFLEDPNGFSGTWMAVKYGDDIFGYVEAKYVVGTDAYNALHPNPILKSVEIFDVFHKSDDCSSNINIFMMPTGGETRYYQSKPISPAQFNNLPDNSSDIPPEFRLIPVQKGYKAKHLSRTGVPQVLEHKIVLKFTYSDGRVINNKYMAVESTSFQKIDYNLISHAEAPTGNTIRIRSAPSTKSSEVFAVQNYKTTRDRSLSIIYLTKRPESITEEWTQVKYISGDGTIYEGYMMSRFVYGTPAYYENMAIYESGITITGAKIDSVIHSQKDANYNVDIKTIFSSAFYAGDQYIKTTSEKGNATVYNAIPLNANTDTYFRSPKTGYHGYHNASTYSGALNHKVKLTVTYSDKTTRTSMVELTTQPISSQQFAAIK